MNIAVETQGDRSIRPDQPLARDRPTGKRLENLVASHLLAEFQQADFLGEPPPQRFDWLFEHTLFCAIQPAQRDEYVGALLRWLKPAGNYLAVNYLIPDTDGPPFARSEYLSFRLTATP